MMFFADMFVFLFTLHFGKLSQIYITLLAAVNIFLIDFLQEEFKYTLYLVEMKFKMF